MNIFAVSTLWNNLDGNLDHRISLVFAPDKESAINAHVEFMRQNKSLTRLVSTVTAEVNQKMKDAFLAG